ncbi:MAG: efflux RND transporter periplasmic adaptor subunit [Kordiimonadaceae bacterium]|nr:efflux RND transporter periplasmic adaptor subunit [Kordiimonadaceae bacterium]
MRKFLIAAAIIGAIAAMAFFSKRGEEGALEMRMADAERGRVATSVLASGTVNYRENIKLRTEVTGRISILNIEEGDVVKAGDLLAVISPELFEADVAQQKAQVKSREIAIERQKIFLAQQKRKLARQQDLHKNGVLNTDVFESTERDFAMAGLDLAARRQELTQAEALLLRSKDQLAKTEIRSPIDGIVTALNVKVGETVVAGTTNIIGSSVMDVSDPSAVLAEVQVEEADILAVKIGQESEITMASAPDSSFEGTVISIGTTARTDTSNRKRFLVKLLVQKPSDNFSRLAVSARAEIFTRIVEDAIKIPVEAVLKDDEDGQSENSSDYVFVNIDGIATRRDVKIGTQTDTSVEVLEGLEEGETLIIGPYRQLKTLKEGKKVEPIKKAKKDNK